MGENDTGPDDPLSGLVAAWRDEADRMERRGLRQQAEFLRSLADDLEEEWKSYLSERLTLDEAEAISHYSWSTLQQKVAGGEIPNAGKKGAPRIQRQDVPKRKPMRQPQSLDTLDVEEASEELAASSLAAQR